MMFGGKGWFKIESKSFEISVDFSEGKIFGVITGQGRSFLTWIRFREWGLALLLEGVETCYQKTKLNAFSKSWLEEL